jgi:AcrR family transcriptional regulator
MTETKRTLTHDQMITDKKTLIHEAVLRLIDKKHNVNDIKVSEIAEEAKIGKGTVYEYFTSKEQLIARSIAYGARKRALSLEELIDKQQSFKNTFLAILKIIGTTMHSDMTLFGHISINKSSFSLHKAIKSALNAQDNEMYETHLRIIEKLVEKGIQEGVIKTIPPSHQLFIAFNSAIMCLFMHKQGRKEFQNLTKEDLLDLTYEVFVKLLQ